MEGGAPGVFVRDPHYPQNDFEGHDQAVRISLLFWFLFLKITKAFCPSGLEETVIIFFSSWRQLGNVSTACCCCFKKQASLTKFLKLKKKKKMEERKKRDK